MKKTGTSGSALQCGRMKTSVPLKPQAWRVNLWLVLLIGSIFFAWPLFDTIAPFPVSAQRQHGLPSPARRLFSDRVVENNTVVVVPVNTGMLHLSDNLLCSLKQTPFNTSSIVFWALDASAQSILQSRGYAAYHDPSLFSVSGNENTHGITKSYKRMMKDRPRFFIDVLTSGFDILMLDADTVFFQSPLSIVPSPETYPSVDIVYSTDARAFYQEHNAFQDPRRRGSRMPPICNGIFWMKSSPRTIALWTEMLEIFSTPWPWGVIRRWSAQDDQRAMDVLLNDGRAAVVGPFPEGITGEMLPEVERKRHELDVSLLDQTSVANGHLLWNHRELYKRSLNALRRRGQDRLAAHFNWNTKEVSKEDGARALEMYFLDDDGGCKLE